MRPAIPATEFEKQRRKAMQLLARGKTVAQVAQQLHRTVRTVYRWKRSHAETGDAGLAAKPSPGRPRSLTKEQERRLRRMLLRGPSANNLPFADWEATLITALILREFGVRFHENHISRIVARLGLSVRELNKRRWIAR